MNELVRKLFKHFGRKLDAETMAAYAGVLARFPEQADKVIEDFITGRVGKHDNAFLPNTAQIAERCRNYSHPPAKPTAVPQRLTGKQTASRLFGRRLLEAYKAEHGDLDLSAVEIYAWYLSNRDRLDTDLRREEYL